MMRTAVALSLLTSKPFRMTSIRAGRAKPGLKAQHLTALDTSVRLWGSRVSGATLGSQVVLFHPGQVRPGMVKVDIGTAGSVTLLLQALLPPLLFAGDTVELVLRGGTDVSMSPPWDYFEQVIAPSIAPLAESLTPAVARRGFYPKGGGEVTVRLVPRFSGNFDAIRAAVRQALPPLALDSASEVRSIEIRSIASEELRKQEVVERQVAGATEVLRHLRTPACQATYVRSRSIGTSVTAVAILASGARLGGGATGERGKRSEAVGREAATLLLGAIESKAPVDENLADHLVPWLAIRGGAFLAASITDHVRTNCWVVEQFLGPTFQIDERTRTITCH